MSDVSLEAARRRTFAIISHPDAGKTTLTEKLLLFGGAIQMAGSVKSRKTTRHATSDWMALEKERGISVTSSVMQFPYEGRIVNLLDTPGHADFGEDTYRVLTAVDSALMVIDVAKGVEERTIKLMEVCRLRDTPIMTFINKLDREPMPIGQVTGAHWMPSTDSTSSSRSIGFLPSRSSLLMKVMIGVSRSRQTSISLIVRSSTPLATSMTISAESTAVSTR